MAFVPPKRNQITDSGVVKERKKKQVSRPLVKSVFQGSGKKREREKN